jgi:outer membrane lipoprotein-sorting protein
MLQKSKLRWIPAIAVPAVVIAGAVAIPSMANAGVSLPSKTAAQIVALAEKSAGTSFSGTVEQTANLGLPDLSSFGGATSSDDDSGVSDIVSQLSGTHKARVFVDGSSKSRVQTLDQLAERDVIRNGSSVWAYDSSDKSAVHLTLPSRDSDTPSAGATPSTGAVPTDPATAAASALKAIGRYTTVSTSGNVRIAGQKAYQVTLAPNDSSSLITTATLAVDATTGVPLRVAVTAKGQTDPAYSVSFTSIDYSTPAASTFAFTPPQGATVKKIAVPDRSVYAGGTTTKSHPGITSRYDRIAKAKAEAQPTVIGTGWSTIIGAKLPTSAVSALSSDDTLDQVFTPVDGGRLLKTALVTVLITDDGEVYAGAVTPSALQAAVAAQ